MHISPYFSDIGANLTDKMFQGIYNGEQKHPADYDDVLNRAWSAGLDKMIITVGTINEADEAIQFASKDGMHALRNTKFNHF